LGYLDSSFGYYLSKRGYLGGLGDIGYLLGNCILSYWLGITSYKCYWLVYRSVYNFLIFGPLLFRLGVIRLDRSIFCPSVSLDLMTGLDDLNRILSEAHSLFLSTSRKLILDLHLSFYVQFLYSFFCGWHWSLMSWYVWCCLFLMSWHYLFNSSTIWNISSYC